MTINEELLNEPSLLRCTLKKSWAVSKKIGLWLGGIAVGLITCYCVYLGVTSSAAANFTGWCISAAGTIAGVMLLVPWELWAIVIGVVSILVYSLVWCMARNLTDEDWESEIAKNVEVATLSISSFIALFTLTFIALGVFSTLVAFTVLILALAALALALTNPKAGCVIGAYLHYRKRIKERMEG